MIKFNSSKTGMWAISRLGRYLLFIVILLIGILWSSQAGGNIVSNFQDTFDFANKNLCGINSNFESCTELVKKCQEAKENNQELNEEEKELCENILNEVSESQVFDLEENENLNPTIYTELSGDLRPPQVSDSSFDRIHYINQAATRKYGLKPELEQILQNAAETTDVQVYIFSGGQPGIESGQPRVGSRRHDFGNAADLYITKNGEKIKINEPVFYQFIEAAFRSGILAGAASNSYMGEYNVHLDIVGTQLGGGIHWSGTNQQFISAANKGKSERTG